MRPDNNNSSIIYYKQNCDNEQDKKKKYRKITGTRITGFFNVANWVKGYLKLKPINNPCKT